MSKMSTWSSRLPFFWWSAAWKPFQMGSQWQKCHWHCEKTHLSKKAPYAFLKSVKILAGHSDRPPHSCQHGGRMVGVVPETDFFHQMADNRSKIDSHYRWYWPHNMQEQSLFLGEVKPLGNCRGLPSWETTVKISNDRHLELLRYLIVVGIYWCEWFQEVGKCSQKSPRLVDPAVVRIAKLWEVPPKLK